MRGRGNNTLFACGDGCWDVKGFIAPDRRRRHQGRGVRVLSAAPLARPGRGIRRLRGARYTKAYGPINNYAANSYDAARIVIAAIERAAAAKQAVPNRAEVLAAMRQGKFQGIAYADPVGVEREGDSTAAVVFVNVVEGDHFKEVDEIRSNQ